MSVWLIALVVSGLAVALAVVVLVRRGLDLYRAFRDSGSALGNGLARVAEAADVTAAKAERLSDRSAAMTDAVARLQRSQAQLNVLIAAARDVQQSVTRLTSVVPRK